MKKYTKKDFLRWNRNPSKPTIKLPPHKGRFEREHWIAHLANKYQWTKGAELGIWRGRTFLHVLEHCPKLTLIGVDLWAPQPDNPGPEQWEDWPHQEYERNVRKQAKRYGERAIIIKDWTSEAVKQVEDNSLDFVFVDADHGTDAVRNDFITWIPKVKDSGVLFGHDINWPTVKVVADELLPGYVIGPDNAWCRTKNINNQEEFYARNN